MESTDCLDDSGYKHYVSKNISAAQTEQLKKRAIFLIKYIIWTVVYKKKL